MHCKKKKLKKKKKFLTLATYPNFFQAVTWTIHPFLFGLIVKLEWWFYDKHSFVIKTNIFLADVYIRKFTKKRPFWWSDGHCGLFTGSRAQQKLSHGGGGGGCLVQLLNRCFEAVKCLCPNHRIWQFIPVTKSFQKLRVFENTYTHVPVLADGTL